MNKTEMIQMPASYYCLPFGKKEYYAQHPERVCLDLAYRSGLKLGGGVNISKGGVTLRHVLLKLDHTIDTNPKYDKDLRGWIKEYKREMLLLGHNCMDNNDVDDNFQCGIIHALNDKFALWGVNPDTGRKL